MESDSFQSEVLKMLQCSICLDTLDNPKGLICQHTFCKTCLDDLLQFRKNGGAMIVCPFKCDRKTFIPVHQTTEDLPAPYQLKGILELHSKQHDGSSSPPVGKCRADNCVSPPSLCCTKCYQSFCSDCKESHTNCHSAFPLSVEGFVPIRYNKSVSKYMPMCVEHLSIANYFCDCSANKFICIYCKERDHNKHKVTDVREKAAIIKDKLQGGQLNTILSNALSVIEQKETIIPESRNYLMHTLWIRKLKELARFVALLNDEEARLLKRFDILSSAHLYNYNEKDKKAVEQFVEKISNNEDFQIVLNERYVTDIHEKYSKITAVKINLSEQGDEKCPLGDLSIEYDIFKYVEASKPINRFTHNFSVVSNVEEEMEKMMKDLNDLLPEVHLIRNPTTKNNVTKDFEISDDEELPKTLDDRGKRKLTCDSKKKRPLIGKKFQDIPIDTKTAEIELLGGKTPDVVGKARKAAAHLLILKEESMNESLLLKESDTEDDVTSLKDTDQGKSTVTLEATPENPVTHDQGKLTKLKDRADDVVKTLLDELPPQDGPDHVYDESFQSSALKKLDNEGLSYLDYLIKGNQVEVMKMLLSVRPELIEIKENHSSPLSSAIKYNNLPIYKLLTDHGARVVNEPETEDGPSSCKKMKLEETAVKKDVLEGTASAEDEQIFTFLDEMANDVDHVDASTSTNPT